MAAVGLGLEILYHGVHGDGEYAVLRLSAGLDSTSRYRSVMLYVVAAQMQQVCLLSAIHRCIRLPIVKLDMLDVIGVSRLSIVRFPCSGYSCFEIMGDFRSVCIIIRDLDLAALEICHKRTPTVLISYPTSPITQSPRSRVKCRSRIEDP